MRGPLSSMKRFGGTPISSRWVRMVGPERRGMGDFRGAL